LKLPAAKSGRASTITARRAFFTAHLRRRCGSHSDGRLAPSSHPPREGLRRRRGGRRFSPWPHSAARRHVLQRRSCDAQPRRRFCCNAVCATHDERADRIVPRREAERPPWGTVDARRGRSVPLAAMTSMMAEPCSARRPRASARVAHVQPRRTNVGLMLASAARQRTRGTCIHDNCGAVPCRPQRRISRTTGDERAAER
jgi:hypothetical protein